MEKLAAIAILLLSFLAGCGRAEVYLGWMASNRPGHMRACYAAFSGSKIRTVRTSTGGTLIVEYGTTVNQGTLTIGVEGPDGEKLWPVILDEDAEDAVVLPVEQPGRYAIVVRGEGTAGSFYLSWKMAWTSAERASPLTRLPRGAC
jgi:hypothetical protein